MTDRNVVRLSDDDVAMVEAYAAEVVAHYRGSGDDLQAMPWTLDLMTDDELRQWLASRQEVARAIDVETCEIGCWYVCAFDSYGVRKALHELSEELEGYTDKANFVRSPESRGWVHEGDLPKDKAIALYDRIYAEADQAAELNGGATWKSPPFWKS